MITERWLNLFNEIFDNGKTNILELADILNISDRTLRYDVLNINDIFIKYFSIKVLDIKQGNIIALLTREKVNEYFSKINYKEYTLSSNEREVLISLDILLFKNNFKLKDFISEYDISKTTLRLELRKIELEFEKYDIYLKNNSKGYYLSKNEFSIRKLIINLIRTAKKENSKNIVFMNLLDEKIKKFSKKIDLDMVKEKLNSFLKKENININDEAYEIILFYIFISYNRNYENELIKNENISNRNFLENTSEYKRVYENFKNAYFTENDCLILTDFYLGLYNFNENYSFFLNWVLVEKFVDNIILSISKEFNLDFNKDRIFRNELIHHIKPAIYRMKNKLKLSEGISIEVKNEYKEIYFKTQKALKYIENILNVLLDDDELAFITIMVKRAIDRIKYDSGADKVKVLIICGLGLSSSKLIAENLTENFDVEIIDLIPYNKLESFDELNKVDLIITTLDFTLNTHEVIKVNPIFKKEDIEILKRYGLNKRSIKISETDLIDFIIQNKNNSRQKISENIRKKYSGYIYENYENNVDRRFHEFFKKTNCAFLKEVKDIDEALKIIGDILYKNQYTKKNYDKNLKAQINKYGSYILIGDKTILPHGEMEKDVLKTGFALLTLKNPIDFFGKKISIIIALASKNKEDHLKAILDLNNFLKIKNFEDEICKIKKYDDFDNYLKNCLLEVEQNENSR